jgi:hypothetical protein
MPTTRYEIYIKGLLCFVNNTRQEFEKVCSDMDTLKIDYTAKIINLI